jgi:hypothetical protein
MKRPRRRTPGAADDEGDEGNEGDGAGRDEQQQDQSSDERRTADGTLQPRAPPPLVNDDGEGHGPSFGFTRA